MPESARLQEAHCDGPCAMVIFGATGDLTRRKLIPAIYNLLLDDVLPENFSIIGASRSKYDDDEFIFMVRERLEEYSRRSVDEEKWNWLAKRMFHVCIDGSGDGFRGLAEKLEYSDEHLGTCGNRLYYLAIPPSAFGSTVQQLAANNLHRPTREDGWSRVIVEKPIGTDLASAQALNRQLNEVFPEKDVFRIDHYLGKETVQNLLVFRFANAIFEPLWNHKYVDHVQITVAESIGVGTRARYYEEAGTTRDMIQNHLFQLLCLTAMEPPVTLDADAIRDEKVKVLQALRPIKPEEVGQHTVRAQYGPGLVGEERAVGYKDLEGVANDSRTETYVGMEVRIDNWRWADVPFYLRSGKRLPKRVTEIALHFKAIPHRLFSYDSPAPNALIIRIQPDEGIEMSFDAKVPGNNPKIRIVHLNFDYASAFGEEPAEAYERLILDAMSGDGTLFIRRDEVEAAWNFIDRLHEGWSKEDPSIPLPEYSSGTWGPTEADLLLAASKRRWRKP